MVSANISLITAAIDPQTKAFSDPHSVIKKEIENVRTDVTIVVGYDSESRSSSSVVRTISE